MLEALLLDNGYLTDVRTAAAGAVAARSIWRAPTRPAPRSSGSGMQARLQLKALTPGAPDPRRAGSGARRRQGAQRWPSGAVAASSGWPSPGRSADPGAVVAGGRSSSPPPRRPSRS
jgi:hypothetical protein